MASEKKALLGAPPSSSASKFWTYIQDAIASGRTNLVNSGVHYDFGGTRWAPVSVATAIMPRGAKEVEFRIVLSLVGLGIEGVKKVTIEGGSLTLPEKDAKRVNLWDATPEIFRILSPTLAIMRKRFEEANEVTVD